VTGSDVSVPRPWPYAAVADEAAMMIRSVSEAE
jgi:hypothetical protein